MKNESDRERAVREYQEAQEALRRRTAQLRALREERDSRVVSLSQAIAERKRSKKQPATNLADWLLGRVKHGRNT
jgi:hypothetical protein